MAQEYDVVSDDLTSEVIQNNIQHEHIPVKEFKPWHRPRKQWVRIKQWKREVQNLIDIIQKNNPEILTNRALAYLSLPGDDLFDIRIIYEACAGKNVKLKFLGFNDALAGDSGISTECSISIAEVVSLPLIDDTSLVIPDKLESIVNKHSIGSDRLSRHGTIDIINIDLCNSVSTPAQRHGNDPTYYDVLTALFRHQVNTRTTPWLLFLTTKCGIADVHPSDVDKLNGCTKSNVMKSKEFCAIMAKLFSLEQFDESDLLGAQAQRTFPAFMQMFCIGFGKWLLQCMMTGISPSKVTMLKSYYYQVLEPGDMISVAYRFEPSPQLSVDPAGLISQYVATAELLSTTEIELAVKIVERTKDLVDVDATLMDSEREMEQMVVSTEALLRTTRYPVERYRSWLSSNGRSAQP